MHVFVQTNDAAANEVVAFRRSDEGRLVEIGRYSTGGAGSGVPHLKSQGSVVVTGKTLLVANAGSDDVSAFAVMEDGLELRGRLPSGGTAPTSIAVRGDLIFVLNSGGEPNLTGFQLGARGLEPLTVARALPGTDPAQAGFTPDGTALLVTDRANDSILELAVSADDLGEPVVHASSGKTPYGFDFAPDGTLVVTEAAGAQVGEASVSSYARGVEPVSRAVRNTRSEVCWAAVTGDGRFAFVTNFGDGTVSSYRIGGDGTLELLDAVAASTNLGSPGIRDEALTPDGRFLYAIDTDARRIFGWAVNEDGSLAPVEDTDGLPLTAAGLAAS